MLLVSRNISGIPAFFDLFYPYKVPLIWQWSKDPSRQWFTSSLFPTYICHFLKKTQICSMCVVIQYVWAWYVLLTFSAHSFVCPTAVPSSSVVETNWLVFLLRPLPGCPPNDLMFHSFSDSSSCAINHRDVIFHTAVPTAGELKRLFS